MRNIKCKCFIEVDSFKFDVESKQSHDFISLTKSLKVCVHKDDYLQAKKNPNFKLHFMFADVTFFLVCVVVFSFKREKIASKRKLNLIFIEKKNELKIAQVLI